MTALWFETAPESGEYRALRALCGLGPRCEDAARIGLAHGLYAVTARDDGDLIAMGRVVGDGGAFVQIVDVAVHPHAQGQGLGRAIMIRLMTWCEAHLPASCHVSLVSSERAAPLYTRFGFQPCRGMDRSAAPQE
ncbi:N-acetyltransferase [Rhodophyticola sp. CCM32]|uniref:GNAT family N-acetyltransferase n=1 Tax=Rhodophyticola sp. CCM32 TaxID=2916397 RepID=UPI00107F4CBD|nr:GNAT family N-acetyltransferase [Rhodophyticola sp. CCM32]QBY00181.1 N-acetyltransferase [Rhodophyticola sp. CCM32]